MKQKPSRRRTAETNIQKQLLGTHLALIIILALLLGIAGAAINLASETKRRDRDLRNVAETIARSPILTDEANETADVAAYLDALKGSLEAVDVISVVDDSGVRLYHSNHDLIGTVYDGTTPDFSGQSYYASTDSGPSGRQRRAYAAVYGADGDYRGFVMAITLIGTIYGELAKTVLAFSAITLAAIGIELLLSFWYSKRLKTMLMGYEPDVFSAMYRMREHILSSLEEGIVAVDDTGVIQFANGAALRMLAGYDARVGMNAAAIGDGTLLARTLAEGEKEFNSRFGNAELLIDRIPVKQDGNTMGAIAILHDRAEYTKLMEELTGTQYLVDSMRANNHDFTNKLHVILGLLQMEMYDEATNYIQNITMVQRDSISRIMNAVGDPAVAALLIGKNARASELNIRFTLREGCRFDPTDRPLPREVLIRVIGNLIDNAFDAMRGQENTDEPNELLFGIFSRPGALLITADDMGTGIAPDDLPHIFEKGYSTKGENRGTGLWQVKETVDSFGGTVTVESQLGAGASFAVSFTEAVGGKENV